MQSLKRTPLESFIHSFINSSSSNQSNPFTTFLMFNFYVHSCCITRVKQRLSMMYLAAATYNSLLLCVLDVHRLRRSLYATWTLLSRVCMTTTTTKDARRQCCSELKLVRARWVKILQSGGVIMCLSIKFIFFRIRI